MCSDTFEKTHSQTPRLLNFIREADSSSGEASGSAETPLNPICNEQVSDLTLNDSESGQPSTERSPRQVITPARSLSSRTNEASIRDLSFSQMQARFRAGETDIVMFSHTVRCYGYDTAVRWAKRDGWKVNI